MGKSKSAPPPPPDYRKLAEEQAILDKKAIEEQTRANRANQFSTEGSLTWSQDPSTGIWTQTTQLSPERQALYDAQLGVQSGLAKTGQGLLGSAQDAVSQPFTLDGLPEVQGLDPSQLQGYGEVPGQNLTPYGQIPGQNLPAMGSLQDPSQLQQWGGVPGQEGLSGYGNVDFSQLGDVPDAGFGAVEQVRDAMMSRMAPDLQLGREREIQRLKAQGLTEGTAAWNNAIQNLDRQANDASQQALLGAAGEYGNIFNRGLASRQQGVNEQLRAAEFANALRGQQFNEQTAKSQYANQLRGLQSSEDLMRAGFANETRGQTLNEQGAIAGYQNDLRGQQFNEQNLAAQYANALRGQQRGEQDWLRGASMQDRQRAIEEQLMLRQMPLNELNAFMSGNQVQGPQFGGYSGAGLAEAADVFGAGQMNYQAALDQYNAEKARKGNKMGGLFTLAGAGVGAMFGGPAGAKLGASLGGAAGGMMGG